MPRRDDLSPYLRFAWYSADQPLHRWLFCSVYACTDKAQRLLRPWEGRGFPLAVELALAEHQQTVRDRWVLFCDLHATPTMLYRTLRRERDEYGVQPMALGSHRRSCVP